MNTPLKPPSNPCQTPVKPLSKPRQKPVVLCILDGWGHSEKTKDNAILAAKTPYWNHLLETSPHCLLETSGLAVGLPFGQMGNSEVGHMTIGAGRVIMQDLPRIDRAIADGSFAKNPALISTIEKLKHSGGAAHILGLCSDGGVHAHINHIIALAEIVAAHNIKVKIHVILDGRDTPPQSAEKYISALETLTQKNTNIKIATVSGRYYAMDRDNRWERVQLAYNAIVLAKGEHFATPELALKHAYAEGKTDEFVIPCVMTDYDGMAKEGDSIIMANFRADRARQIFSSLIDPKFTGFERARTFEVAAALGLVEYSEILNPLHEVMFSSQKLDSILPEIIAESGLTQLRIAETEKYAHVTFFFNGGKEGLYLGEERILVPSPKVATYDLQPEMSSAELTEKLVSAVKSDDYDFIVVNYANTDMVGHTGDFFAATHAVEAVDKALGAVSAAVTQKCGILLITADHGNAEEMHDDANSAPHTQHTLNPVPFIAVGLPKTTLLHNGSLANIASTVLELLQLQVPEMMANSLLK